MRLLRRKSGQWPHCGHLGAADAGHRTTGAVELGEDDPGLAAEGSASTTEDAAAGRDAGDLHAPVSDHVSSPSSPRPIVTMPVSSLVYDTVSARTIRQDGARQRRHIVLVDPTGLDPRRPRQGALDVVEQFGVKLLPAESGAGVKLQQLVQGFGGQASCGHR